MDLKWEYTFTNVNLCSAQQVLVICFGTRAESMQSFEIEYSSSSFGDITSWSREFIQFLWLIVEYLDANFDFVIRQTS